MKIISIASALLLVALGLNSCTQQNTEVKVGSSPSNSADTDVKTNSSPPTLAVSKLFLFTRNGKYGYIDRTGKIVIPAKFESAENFSEGLATVKIGGKFGCIDKTGKLVIPAQFDSIEAFENGIAVASSESGSGMLDRSSNFTPHDENSNSATLNRDEIISFDRKDYAANIKDEFMYRVGLHKRIGEGNYLYGYKNRRTGKVIVRPQFREAAHRFSEGLAWVMNEQYRVGYIDKQGKVVIPPQYKHSVYNYLHDLGHFGSDFNGGLAKVCSAGESSKCGYIDLTGKVVIPLKFADAAEKFSNGLAWVSIEGGGFGYINKTGKIVLTLHQSYSGVGNFDGGLAKVCSEGNERESRKCGYIDRTGKVVIPLKFYEAATKFSNGLAWVVIDEHPDDIDGMRLGYIDKTGKVKIPLKFTFDFQPSRPHYFEDGPFVWIGDTNLDVNFDRGLAAVKIPKTCQASDGNDCDRIGYVDTTGKLVFEF